MGEFEDMLDAPFIRYEQYGFQTIDPCFFKDSDGRIYLLWGQGKCYMAEVYLDPNKAEFIGEPVSISDHLYWQRSTNPNDFDITIYNEAPDLIKYKGRYLLTWSIYDVRDVRYRIRYAWADNVWGPYIQPIDETHDNILIKGQGDIQCTGHAAISEYKDELYLIYHRYVMPRQGYHRQTCCDKVIFTDDVHIKVMPSK
jgi:beta-xylosidase